MPRVIPANFEDPIGLTARLVRSRDPAALFALASTALTVVATPLDAVLAASERRLYGRAGPPQLPIVIVTGAPRSGTTVVSQVLSQHLPVTYFNNLTAVFPRAPIVANRVFGRLLRRRRPIYRSFYGRTHGFAAQNDGLHLWERWLGQNRYSPPDHLDPAVADRMVRFFGAYQAAFGGPILTKNNALATAARLIAAVLPTSHFIFVRREPEFAVQSILGAREVIQGSRAAPYGVSDPRYHGNVRASPIDAVCAQVAYHERRMREQQREIGERRFWVLPYEDFCHEPEAIVTRVGREILGLEVDSAAVRAALPAFNSTNRVTLPAAEFDDIRATLVRLGVSHLAQAATS